jgi:hypothetical protein
VNGSVAVNVQPWAEIREVRDSKGTKIPTPLSVTPCQIQLPPGKYTIVVENPRFGKETLAFEIRGNQTTIINEKLEGFDYARAIDSLGL